MLRIGNLGLKMGVSRAAHTQYAYIWKYPPPPPRVQRYKTLSNSSSILLTYEMFSEMIFVKWNESLHSVKDGRSIQPLFASLNRTLIFHVMQNLVPSH